MPRIPWQPVPSEFQELLRQAVAQFPRQKDCARALGVSPQRLNEVLNARSPYAFNVENCVRLAHLLNVTTSRVLRVADKADIADMLEAAYGLSDLTPADQTLLARWHALPDATRALIAELVGAIPPQAPCPKPPAPPAAPRRRRKR